MSEHDELLAEIEKLRQQVAKLSAQVAQLLSRAPVINVYPNQNGSLPRAALPAPNTIPTIMRQAEGKQNT